MRSKVTANCASDMSGLETSGGRQRLSDGSPLIPGSVPDTLIKQGLTEVEDTLKLIASTEECDATLLDQPDHDVHFVSRSRLAPNDLSNTLIDLMSRVQTRHFGQTIKVFADWITTQLTLTIIAPRKSISVPSEDKHRVEAHDSPSPQQ